MTFLELPYTDQRKITFKVPDGTVAKIYQPQLIEMVQTPEDLVTQALDNPLESARLEEKARAGDNVLIICDDITRPTPVDLLIPPVLDRLNRAGVPDSDIRVLFALGTHRPMAESEMRAKVGDAVFRRVACDNHNAFNKAELYYFGRSEDGVEIWLNRKVNEATFIIGVGGLAPHSMVGYGGGAKIMYPGIAGAETVLGFHINLSLDPTNYHGVYPSPGRSRIRNLANVVGLDFVVNSVSGHDDRIYAVYAGQHNAVLEEGIKVARRIYGVSTKQRQDVVVVSSYPKWRELWQGVAGAYCADTLVKPAGEIILVTACPEGGARSYNNYANYVGMRTQDLARLLRERTCRTVSECLCIAGAIKAAYMREKHRISVVSDGLSPSEIAQMGFEQHLSVEAALAAAYERKGWQAEIGVMPYGGHTYCYGG